MAELDDATHERIKDLCAKGDSLAEAGQYGPATAKYAQAWDLLPEPHGQWDAATWILAAIGDAHYHAGDFEQARRALSHAMHCPDAIGNPFLHLRLGEVQYELGNMERAKDELARALILEGKELFKDEDPKYFAFITKYLRPPAGQKQW